MSEQVKITIIYTYRNRDAKRVRYSLLSLQQQCVQNFKVLFIDYGSEVQEAKAVQVMVEGFRFASYHYVAHEGLLWNKSKALNYGIKHAETSYIITSDIDVLFAPQFVKTVATQINPGSFSLFQIGYLSKKETKRQLTNLDFDTISTTHIGDTFGIALFPKKALETVRGLDEFFHFYGSEDEDLNQRVQMAGYKLKRCNELMLYHQWHMRYPKKQDNVLHIHPRLTNVVRLNQRHFLWHKAHCKVQTNPKSWGNCYSKADLKSLERPDIIIQLDNILAHVEHCFGVVLAHHSNSIVQIIVSEAPYYKSLKYKLKQALGKQTQSYMTMKAVNDLILKEILYRYRDMNYAYKVTENLKHIYFTIDFKTRPDDQN
ncbi:glycosyltransferase family 2 protein [Corallibacter sp.]|uniref:glycosyltransferase family 2 protein n=1 Tax=Corallibacter sp. TaxID=2038084 RepID=UPI003AB68F75